MQVLVSEVVLPGGWCSFCFYLVSHSSHCSCYLYWNCCSLFILPMVGLFCDQNFLLPNCFILYLGGCHVSLLRQVLRWWYLWVVPLLHSGVICLCDGKLNILYPAEMINHFIFVFRFYSQSYGGRFLCVAGLRGHWVPPNSFLLHKWVSTLVL